MALVLTVAMLASDGLAAQAVFKFYWGQGCPHCDAARPFVRALEKEHPKLRFESWEVRRDPVGRKHFVKEVKRLKIKNPSVPTFICGDEYVVGFRKGQSEACVRDLLRRCSK